MKEFTAFAFACLYGQNLASPLDQLSRQGKFTLQETAVEGLQALSGEDAMIETYLKYGVEPLEDIEKNIFFSDQAYIKGTIPAVPSRNDQQYLISAQVGHMNMTLDLDTGSSDLWVVSTFLSPDGRGNRPVNRLYDPKMSSFARILSGSFWKIVYGDKSSASGSVYVDRVTIGGLTVDNQAVQVASNISQSFLHDGSKDGFIGLSFAKGNTVKPSKQPTWFDNVRSKLQQPVFAAALKRHSPGSYDFGYVDPAKYTGRLFYTEVAGKNSHWDFTVSGVTFNGPGPMQNTNFPAIVDTGTSLWYMPEKIVDSYWKQVEGATFTNNKWLFPCNSYLPDITVSIADGKVTVPGVNMNYAHSGQNMCMGGLQRDLPMGFSIFGDVFMKGLYIVHEAPINGKARIGFAKGR